MGWIEKGGLGPGTAFPTKEPFGNNLSNSDLIVFRFCVIKGG